MPQERHKYYCSPCKEILFGTNPAALAANVNEHNYERHPLSSCMWNEHSITLSAYYINPGDDAGDSTPQLTDAYIREQTPYLEGPRPEYIVPYVNKELWGDAKKAPDITSEDIRLLARNKIKW
jgi:hypothetical protein